MICTELQEFWTFLPNFAVLFLECHKWESTSSQCVKHACKTHHWLCVILAIVSLWCIAPLFSDIVLFDRQWQETSLIHVEAWVLIFC